MSAEFMFCSSTCKRQEWYSRITLR